MTIHYHGTPITPRAELLKLAGRHFCVSFASPNDVGVAHEIGQSVMLDNGAYSIWRRGGTLDVEGYFSWCDRWLGYPTTWAVLPDIIDGTIEDNDNLLYRWPFGRCGAAPVWHLNETRHRLLRLVEYWDRVCLGSSGEYATVGSDAWHRRIESAFNALERVFKRTPWIHMLRGMSLAGSKKYPFASLDSTDVARNHNRPQNSVIKLVNKWDALQCAGQWTRHPEQVEMFMPGPLNDLPMAGGDGETRTVRVASTGSSVAPGRQDVYR